MPLNNTIVKEDLLADFARIGVIQCLKKHKNDTISSIELTDLYEQNNDNLAVQSFLSKFPTSPSRVLIEMAEKTENVDILVNLANHARIPQQLLISLAEKNICEVNRAIAKSKQITPNTADILSASNDVVTLTNLAGNQNVQARHQIELSERDEISIINALIIRKNLHHTAFKNCLKHSSYFLATALSVSKSIDESSLLEIADSNNIILQDIMLDKAKLSDKILESLYFSKHQVIIQKAIEKKELSEDEFLFWSESNHIEIRKIIAGKKNLPNFIESNLLNDIDIEVLKTLAKNETISEIANIQLIKKDINSSEISPILAEKENLSPRIIKALCFSENIKILKILTFRKDLTDEHINILVNENYSPEIIFHLKENGIKFKNISLDSTEKIAYHKSASIRVFGVESENMNAQIAEGYCNDPADIVRLAFVKSLKVKKYLQKLESDNNEEIASIAKKKLDKIVFKELKENNEIKNKKIKNSTGKIFSKIINKLKK